VSQFYFEYDRAHHVLAVRLLGEITDDVFKASYAATARVVEGLDITAALTDLSGVERYDVSAAAVREVSKLHPLFPDPMPRCVIAPRDDVFGMARMFQIVSPAGRDTLYVVRSVQEAYDALGLTDTPHFEPVTGPPGATT